MTAPEYPLAEEFKRHRATLARALEYTGGTHTLDDVWEGVLDGRFQLWTGPGSIVVTELLAYPQCRTLHFFLAAGKMEELTAMYPAILEWGKALGCSKASLAGRPGWTRGFLQREGWRASHLVMTKELEP